MSDEQTNAGELAASISRSVVRAIAETTGRGPTKARTTIGQDSIFVVVRDALTKGERALVDAGDSDAVLRLREAWQRVMHGSLNEEIERLTGRHVIGFMSANHVRPDLGVEIFILEPDGSNGRVSEGEGSS
jgi:uncharacterized protein YbcI